MRCRRQSSMIVITVIVSDASQSEHHPALAGLRDIKRIYYDREYNHLRTTSLWPRVETSGVLLWRAVRVRFTCWISRLQRRCHASRASGGWWQRCRRESSRLRPTRTALPSTRGDDNDMVLVGPTSTYS
jgi:hypothetical protein